MSTPVEGAGPPAAAEPGVLGRWVTFHTGAPEETEELGAALGRAAFPGAAILLEGSLGAGKTVLARGIARGLRVREPLTSPSFTILAIHPGRETLFHLDLYRVSHPRELRAIALEELFSAGGVVVVEWPRWLREELPAGALEVEIEIDPPKGRRLRLRARDPRWAEAVATLPGGFLEDLR